MIMVMIYVPIWKTGMIINSIWKTGFLSNFSFIPFFGLERFLALAKSSINPPTTHLLMSGILQVFLYFFLWICRCLIDYLSIRFFPCSGAIFFFRTDENIRLTVHAPKMYRKSVLHLLKYTTNLYLSRCSTFLDTHY